MLRKYTKKMFLDYASAFDYYEDMKETLQHNIGVIEKYDLITILNDRIYNE